MSSTTTSSPTNRREALQALFDQLGLRRGPSEGLKKFLKNFGEGVKIKEEKKIPLIPSKHIAFVQFLKKDPWDIERLSNYLDTLTPQELSDIKGIFTSVILASQDFQDLQNQIVISKSLKQNNGTQILASVKTKYQGLLDKIIPGLYSRVESRFNYIQTLWENPNSVDVDTVLNNVIPYHESGVLPENYLTIGLLKYRFDNISLLDQCIEKLRAQRIPYDYLRGTFFVNAETIIPELENLILKSMRDIIRKSTFMDLSKDQPKLREYAQTTLSKLKGNLDLEQLSSLFFEQNMSYSDISKALVRLPIAERNYFLSAIILHSDSHQEYHLNSIAKESALHQQLVNEILKNFEQYPLANVKPFDEIITNSELFKKLANENNGKAKLIELLKNLSPSKARISSNTTDILAKFDKERNSKPIPTTATNNLLPGTTANKPSTQKTSDQNNRNTRF